MAHLLTPEMVAEPLIRLVATAAIVIGVTLAVERLGPLIGGALAGLPIVIGPGFFFLIQEHGADFIVAAAASSLLSLCATETFLLSYCLAALRQRAAVSIAAASGAWLLAAVLLSYLPSLPWLGLAAFIAAATLARWVGRGLLRPAAGQRSAGGMGLLVVKGVSAGLVVVFAMAAAEWLGPGWSGFIVTYPVGFTVVSVTLHQRIGTAATVATLHAAMRGIASLATFSFTLAATIMHLGAGAAFSAALLAAVSLTGFLSWRSARPAGRAERRG